MSVQQKLLTAILVLLLSGFLIDCGGGGSGGNQNPPPPQLPSESTITATPTSGGQTTIKSDGGVEITLAIPPGAVSSNVDVSISIQPNVGNIPLASQVALAVKLEPEGLQFDSPATLTFKSLSLPTDAVGVGYLANNDGSGFHFIAATKSGADTQLQIPHFSNTGVMGLITDEEKVVFFKLVKEEFDKIIYDMDFNMNYELLYPFTCDYSILKTLSTRIENLYLLANDTASMEFSSLPCKTSQSDGYCSTIHDFYNEANEYRNYKLEQHITAKNVACSTGLTIQQLEPELLRCKMNLFKLDKETLDKYGDYMYGDTYSFNLTCGQPVHISSEPVVGSLQPGDSINLNLHVYDEPSNLLPDRSVTWIAAGEANGITDNSIFTLNSNGQSATLTANKAGVVNVFALDSLTLRIWESVFNTGYINFITNGLLDEGDIYAIGTYSIGDHISLTPWRLDLRSTNVGTFSASAYIGDVLQPASELTWQMADTSIADIDSFGSDTVTVYAKQEGETTLTVRHPASGMSATSTISVTGLHVAVKPEKACLHPLQTQQFSATIKDKHGRVLDLYTPVWLASSTNSVAINPTTGLAIAGNPGTATITARVNLGDGIIFDGTADLFVPSFPDDLVATRVIREDNLNAIASDLKLTNSRQVVELNYASGSVRETIIKRAAENGLVLEEQRLRVVDVNQNRQAIATYYSAPAVNLLFDFDSSTYVTLLPPNYPADIAPPELNAMNDSGQVLMTGSINAREIIIFKDGDYTTITPPAPWTRIWGFDISNNGTIMGVLGDEGGTSGIAYSYHNGEFTLNVPPYVPSYAYASVNDDGVMIVSSNQIYYQGSTYYFGPGIILNDINEASDILLTDIEPITRLRKPYIYHLCPLP